MNFGILDGLLLKRSIDLFRIPPERICNLIYFQMIDGLPEDEKVKLDMELERPRPGEEPDDGMWSSDQMASDFDKAMAAQTSPTAPKPKKKAVP